MSRPELHAKFFGIHLRNIERDLATLDRLGVLKTDPAYKNLMRDRDALIAREGRVVPRSTVLLAWSFGFSPGIIKIWHDAEMGWMSEARTQPGAPPIYKSVSDAVAVAIIKEEVTPELEKELMTPDPYLGE